MYSSVLFHPSLPITVTSLKRATLSSRRLLRRHSTVTSNLTWETEAVTDVSLFCQVFYVIKGTVMVTVHQCSTVLHSGSTFFVPQGKFFWLLVGYFCFNTSCYTATCPTSVAPLYRPVHVVLVVWLTLFSFFYFVGNSYNIKNLKKTDAKLMFVQIKG